jgi:hypothetical protein
LPGGLRSFVLAPEEGLDRLLTTSAVTAQTIIDTVAGTRKALLIATSSYSDATFRQLRAPRHDANELANVLGDKEIGDYRVDVLANEPSHTVRIRINELFTQAARDDLMLLYFSGHGVKDESGRLHLATTDTRRTLLAATAVSAQFIRELIDHSPARRVVVWLDCCYAGAFPSGRIPRAEGTVDVLTQLTGRGCAVMTASTHIQYAFERGADPQLRGDAQPSVFTHAIVKGLLTGAADLNDDGMIDAAELYAYVYDQVKASTPEQTPTRNDQVTGELYIARNKRGRWLHPDLPSEIRHGLRSRRPGFRDAAIAELNELSRTGTAHERTIATETLRQLTEPPTPPPASISERPEPAPPRRPPRHLGLTLWSEFPGLATKLVLAAVFAFWAYAGFDQRRNVVVGVILAILAGLMIVSMAFNVRRMFSSSRILRKQNVGPLSVGFRPDGRLLVCASEGEGTLWDTGTWKKSVFYGLGRCVAFSPSGDILVTTRWILDGRTCEPLEDYDSPSHGVQVFSPSGAELACGKGNGIELYETATWTAVRQLPDAHSEVATLAYAPSGELLASGGRGHEILLWDTGTWRVRHTLYSHASRVAAIAFSSDGMWLACAGPNGPIEFWRIPDAGAPARGYQLRGTAPIAFSSDGRHFAYASGFHRIKLWDIVDKTPMCTLIGHHQEVTSLAFSPGGELLASTSRDGTLRVWPIKLGQTAN